MTASAHRVAVIGGGIAGLSAAHALLAARPDLQVTVYEANASVGGKLRAGEVGGVTVDLGAESMLNRRPEGLALAEAVGLEGDIVHPATSSAAIWTRGALRPLPPTLMGIPADLAALAHSGILTSAGMGRVSLERRLPEPDLSEDVGFGVLVARRLGRDVRDRLVEPLLGGVYAGRSDEISLQAALPEVVTAIRTSGGLLNAARATRAQPGASGGEREVFAGLRGGMARLPQATADQLERQGVRVERNALVRTLTRTSNGWELVVGTTTGHREDADAVVLATPAPASAKLLREAAPAAARELAAIEYASLAIVTLAFGETDLRADLAGSGFLVPPIDKRVVKAATFSSSKWPWMSGDPTIVRCSIGRHGDERDLQRDDSELVDAALTDLKEATGLHAPLLEAMVTRWGGALPQYAVGHLDRVRRIEQSVEDSPALAICGAALGGVGIPAVIASAQRAATRVIAQLESVETMEP